MNSDKIICIQKELANFASSILALGQLASSDGVNQQQKNFNSKRVGFRELKTALSELEKEVHELTRVTDSPSLDELMKFCNVIYKQNKALSESLSARLSKISCPVDPKAAPHCNQEQAKEIKAKKSLKNRQQTPGKPPKRYDDVEEEDDVENSDPAPTTMVKASAEVALITAAPNSVLQPLATNQKASFIPPSAMRASRPQVKPSPSPRPSLTPDLFLLSPSILALQQKYDEPSSSLTPTLPPSSNPEAPSSALGIDMTSDQEVNHQFSGFPQLISQESSTTDDDTQSLWKQVIRSNGVPTPNFS